MHEKQNSAKYRETLETGIMSFVADIFGESSPLQFQHDGAAINGSWKTINRRRSNTISTLMWSEKSPDIYIIENVWGVMVRKVYSGHRIYNTLADLKHETKGVWKSLTVEYLRNIYQSILRRLFVVIDAKGEDTKSLIL